MNTLTCWFGHRIADLPDAYQAAKIPANPFIAGATVFFPKPEPVALLNVLQDGVFKADLFVASLKKVSKHCLATNRQVVFCISSSLKETKIATVVEQEILKKGIPASIEWV